LDIDPKKAEAYLGLFMADIRARNRDVAKEEYITHNRSNNRNFERAKQFATGSFADELTSWDIERKERIIREEERIRKQKESEEEKTRQIKRDSDQIIEELKELRSQIKSNKYRLTTDERTELTKLKTELAQVENDIKQENEVIESSQEKKELAQIEKEIQLKKEALQHLGIFKGREKRELQLEIDKLIDSIGPIEKKLKIKQAKKDKLEQTASEIRKKVDEFPAKASQLRKSNLQERLKNLNSETIEETVSKADECFNKQEYKNAIDLYSQAKIYDPESPHIKLYVALSKGWLATIENDQFELINKVSERVLESQHQKYGDTEAYFKFCYDAALNIAKLLNATHDNYIKYHNSLIKNGDAFLNSAQKEAQRYMKFGTQNCCDTNIKVINCIVREVKSFKEANVELLDILCTMAHNCVVYRVQTHSLDTSDERAFEKRVANIRERALNEMKK